MDVLVDINKIDETKRVYSSYAKELDATIDNLKKSVDKIKAQWKGAAKDGFENSHFPKVYQSMKDHSKRVEDMAKELDYITKEFTALEKDIASRTK